jgi:cytochrome c-type biogenesis protein CcsB
LAGFVAHTAAGLARWADTGHVPITTPYENALTGAWVIILMTLAAPRAYGMFRAAGIGAVGLALVGLGWAAVALDRGSGPMAASLRSTWLAVHVLFAMLAYGAFSVAAGAALGYLVKVRKGERGALGRMPSPDTLDEIAYRYVIFGFITWTVMIAAGAIWAKDLWGAYWAWDPVEMWSLVAWLGYGVLIHLRVTYGWRGSRFAWYALFAVVLVTVAALGVNLIANVSQHMFTVPTAP